MAAVPVRSEGTPRSGADGPEADSGPDVSIRTCQRSDLPTLRHFQQAFREETEQRANDTEDARIENRLSAYCLIAEIGGDPVGYLVAQEHTPNFLHSTSHPVPFPGDSGYIEVQEVYVAPEFRRRAIGTTLVDAALFRARRNGLAHSAAQSTGSEHESVTRFYERCGFRVWRVMMSQ